MGAALAYSFSSFPARGIQPGDLDSLKTLRARAERSPAAGRDAAWFRVAAFAVELATSGGEPKPVAAAEQELVRACKQLAPASLAAVAARGQHPILSAAYARAMANAGSPPSLKNPRPSGAQEAGAEVRDAFRRFGAGSKDLLEIAKKFSEAASGAGGASQSVYRIAVLAPESAGAGRALGAGLRAGIRDVAASWSDRFVVADATFTDADVDTRRAVHREIQRGAGVVVVGGGDVTLTAAAAAGTESRVVVLDARDEEQTTVESPWKDRASANSRPFDVAFMPNLSFMAVSGASAQEDLPPFVVRPSPCDQARALAQVVLARGNLSRVAILVPSAGGAYDLARCFELALSAIKREVVEIEYEPGRRDFSPEVRRLRDANVQAVLLAGPAEESEEWLVAMRKARLAIVVFGTDDLDPNGMHDFARSAAEGVIFAASEWEFVRADDIRRALRAAERDSFAESQDYSRGYRLGRNLARTIMDGAFTPSRLHRELSWKARSEGTRTPPRLAGDDALDRLPLYVIRNGKSERVAAGAR